MHTCMAPYKMGDISSCHCFTTSWAAVCVFGGREEGREEEGEREREGGREGGR